MNRMRMPALLLSCLLLSSCVVTQQDLQMQRDLMETKRRLNEAERAVKELQDDTSGGVRAHVETLARNQADFQAGLDGVRVDLQSMQGRSSDQARINDEMSQELSLLRDEMRLQIADHDNRLAQLESASPVTRAAISAAEPESVSATVASAAKPPVVPVAESTPVVAPAVKATPVPAATVSVATPVDVSTPASASTPAGENAPELYARALNLIRQDQQFAEGRELMELFLKRYPEDALAVNAAYWVGETYYAEKSYGKAILQFEEIIQKDGAHPKVAAATLKQALAFEALGDQANATLLLKRVVERFPLSDEAAIAKEKLPGQVK